MTPMPITRPMHDDYADDRKLVARLVEGDESAFDELSETLLPRLYRFALSRLHGDEDLAGDVVQSTLCKVIHRLDTYRGDAALFTWLCSCCRNEMLMHFRRAGARPEEVDLDAAAEAETRSAATASEPESQQTALLRKESAALVHEALDRMPTRYALALEWKYLEGISVKQIAWRLRTSEKAAESLLTRAREAFRGAWAEVAGQSPTAPPPTASVLEATGSPS